LNARIAKSEYKKQLALTLLGCEKRKLTYAYFERFSEGLELTSKLIHFVFKRFEKNKSETIHWIK
jgi:hypothetical protein